MMIKAVRIHETGGPEVLSVDQVEIGAPGPGEVLVRHAAIGLNFVDMHHRAGRYPLDDLPATLGMEAAGTVEAIGPDVTTVKPGDRIAYSMGGPGAIPRGYAEAALVPEELMILLPDEIDAATGAAMLLKGLTAQYLIRGAYPVQAGETVLVHAAAGGVGILLSQWARHLGARVIGTVGSPEKAELAAAHGCHHVIQYDRQDVAARVRALTGGEGVPVVFDAVGKDTFEASLSSLAVRGTLVAFGTASGPTPPLNLFELNRRGSLYVTSAGLAWYTRSRAELLQRAGELVSLVARGVLKVPIHQQWPLDQAADAHRALENRQTTAMSVLVP
jgi:NADPH2:quinone reductase